MKAIGKKITALSAAAVLAFSVTALSACGGGGGQEEEPTGSKTVSLTDTNGVLTMGNGNISLSVKKENGSITDITYLGKNAGIVHGEGANFTLAIDPTTNDVFKANHAGNATVVLKSYDFAPSVNTVCTEEKGQIELTYDLSYSYNNSTVSGIRVKNTIVLEKNNMFFTSDYEVTNNAQSSCVVVTLTGAQISGIQDVSGSPWSLYWPDREGKLVDEVIPLGKKIKTSYPSRMAVQLLQVYNGSVSFDYSVLDTEGVYKEFCFGRFIGKGEYDEGRQLGYQTSMACTQFPFVKQGATEKVSTIRIGAGGEGSWYEGADRYRDFLISSGMTRAKNELTKEWTGMLTSGMEGNSGIVVGTYLGNKENPRSYADIIGQADGTGINTLCAIGWHEGGFDHMYPDYEYSVKQGGEAEFGQMITQLDNNDKNIICYINAHIADVESKWSKEMSAINPNLTKIREAATKRIGFEYGVTEPDSYEDYMYYEPYNGLASYAISPMSSEFYDAVIAAVQSLADKGVDGIWFDQLMEMPCMLDYDSSHGAKNPATAYSEGYKKLLPKVCEIMEKATNNRCLFVCEGVCDAYIRYIDVCGLMWARNFGGTDGDGVKWAAETTRYTIPSLMLGLPSADATRGSGIEYGRAFVYGNPLLTSVDAQISNPAVTSVINTYKAAPKIYFEGRFMDTRGLRVGNSNVISSLILGSDGSLGLQLLNNSNQPIESLKVIIDPSALGLAGKVATVVNLQTNESVEIRSENTFALTLNPFSMNAYKITVEE